MKIPSKLTLLSFPFLLLLTLTSSDNCNPNDKAALLRFKQDLHNPYALASWNPATDCCDWYVVRCDPTTHRIVELNLFSSNISGQIPASLGNLPFLETLVLRKLTNLTGPIPRAIANLTNLKLLRLSYTNLSGPVPAFLSQLKNITFIDLSYNDLTGTIPSSLSSLRSLAALHLEGNNLTGTIPENFPGGNAPDLYLSRNQLTGAVPRSFGGLNFTVLDFSRNQLVGDVSFLFGRNKTLSQVDLSRNMFEFDVTRVEFQSELQALDLSHNRINGSLPEGLSRLDNLQAFNVSYNRLCGRIPTGGKLSGFDASCYVHNKCLCGAPLQACT